MRKLYWWGAASLVAGAAAVYLVADHVARRPDSLLSRYVTMSMSREFLFKKGGTPPAVQAPNSLPAVEVVKEIHRVLNELVAAQDHQAAHAAATDAGGPLAADCPNLEAVPHLQEVNEPIRVDVPVEGAEDVPAAGAPGPNGVVRAGYGKPAEVATPEECEHGAACVPPSAPEEPEATMLMPRCGEEEGEAGLKMPYIEEDPELRGTDVSPFSLWFSWLKLDAAKEGGPKKAACHGECELVPAGPESPLPEGGSAVPDCQVDPNYPHQYPGCPFMGGCCPQSGGCPVARPEVDCPPPQKRKKVIKAHPTSLPKKEKSSKRSRPTDEEWGGRCTLDTMEARPSDVKKTGFDPSDPF
jgi:hypothetical protein